jgi:glycosyltransferase involved in cell wall biosynthesis
MRVLIIPSWLPYTGNPLAGKFFVDQAIALAETGLANVMLLDWGQNEFQLAVRHPIASFSRILRLPFARRRIRTLAPNLMETRIPHLTWTSLVARGNIDSLARKVDLPEKPDLIHAHVTFPAGYLAMKLAEKYGIPFIITEHSGPFPFPEFIRRGKISPLVTEPLRSARKIIAVSTYLRQEIRAKTGHEAQVIPNLVNTSFYHPGQDARQEGPFRIFALSAFSLDKGALDLMQTLKILKSYGTDWQLLWGGTGPLLPQVKRDIEEEGLGGKVTFLGRLNPDQALEQYQQCDCFVLPSRIESFSMVLIEALACGKPVVATNCGGPKDIVDTCCGILVPKQNPMALAKALASMSASYQRYSPEKIREYCVGRFGHHVIALKIIDLYKQLLAGSTPIN